MSGFVLIISVLFFCIAIINLRYAFFTYLALLPFIPGYFAIPFGGGGAGISIRRIITYSLLLIIGMRCFIQPKIILKTLSNMFRWRLFSAALMTLLLAKLLGTVGSNELIGIAYLIDELAEVIVVLYLANKLIYDQTQFRFLVKVILVSALFCQLIVLFEAAIGHHLLQGLINVEVTTVGENVLEGHTRDGHYRTMGLFDNPLSLAEFSCWAFIFAYIGHETGGMKKLSIAVFMLTPFVLYSTGVRSGFLMLCISLVAWAYQKLIPGLAPEIRTIIRATIFIATASVLILLANTLASTGGIDWFMDTFLSGTEEENRSTAARLFQYLQIFTAMSESPWFGYGIKNHVIEDLGNTLDSYYLRVLIEAGILGLCAFAIQIWAASKIAKESKDTFGKHTNLPLYFMLLLSVFVFYKFFLSMNGNNIYFYIVIGVMTGIARPPLNNFSSSAK